MGHAAAGRDCRTGQKRRRERLQDRTIEEERVAKSDRKGPRAAERDSARAASVRGEHKQMERSVNKIGMKRFEEMFAAVFVSERRARPAPARPCARRPSAPFDRPVAGRCVCGQRKSVLLVQKIRLRVQKIRFAGALFPPAHRRDHGRPREAQRVRAAKPANADNCCRQRPARGRLQGADWGSGFSLVSLGRNLEASGRNWKNLEESGSACERLAHKRWRRSACAAAAAGKRRPARRRLRPETSAIATQPP